MITKSKVYKMKEEFCKELNIPRNQVERRLDELLEWLTNFYDYEFYEGRPNRILIKEVYGEYQPMPRKIPSQKQKTQEKIEDYTNFTIAALGTEFKPNSKSKIAREAIAAFGYEKYSHTHEDSVARRYIKEPFDTYGETDNRQTWVLYSTYEPMEEEILNEWRNILVEEHIAEEEAANAFYKYSQGEDISQEISYYKKALSRFKDRYDDTPVLVKNWKLKT